MDVSRPPIATIGYLNPQDLRLHVYITGYSSEGESVLVIVAEKDIPLLAILTDSYSINPNDSQTYFCKDHEILEKCVRPKINLFIWTHPHEDHSVGIPQILDEFDGAHEAYIFLPNNLVGYQDHPEIKQTARDAYGWLKRNYKSRILYVGCNQFQPINQYIYNLKCESEENLNLRFELNFFAPHDLLMASQADNKNFTLNCATLAYLISINGITIFMGGDLDDKALKYIDQRVYDDIDLIKIPHHGSDQVKSLIPKFETNCCSNVHAATTIYTKGKDPKRHIIDAYKALPATVHFTGTIGNGTTTPAPNYGCIEYEYDLYQSIFKDVKPSGHALQV